MPFTQDFATFFATIYGGIIIGFIFDIHRALKCNFKVVNYLSLLFDTIFWLFTTLITFITINAVESFDLRYYHFVALFIGFILYYKTISRFILTAINNIITLVTNLVKKVLNCIVGILNNLYYVIIYSIHLIFDIIFYIPNLLLYITKFVKVKYKKSFKIKKKIKDKNSKKSKKSNKKVKKRV